MASRSDVPIVVPLPCGAVIAGCAMTTMTVITTKRAAFRIMPLLILNLLMLAQSFAFQSE